MKKGREREKASGKEVKLENLLFVHVQKIKVRAFNDVLHSNMAVNRLIQDLVNTTNLQIFRSDM